MSAAPKLPQEKNDLSSMLEKQIRKKVGSGPLNKKLASMGFGAGAILAFGPLAPYLDKYNLDQIALLKMIPIPVPGGPKVLVVGAVLAVIGYLVGELLDSSKQ